MDPNEMRFRAQHSPRSDATTMNSLTSPQRNRLSQNYQQQQQQQQQIAQDPRTNLSRRFTTDSGRVPTLSSNIGGPRGPDEYQSLQGLHLIEKKRLAYEKIVESKRLFDAEMQRHEQEHSRRFEAEIQKHQVELSQAMEEHGRLAGHQSEPTTPPEYRETTTGFPTALSRPNANRYSLSVLQSPPGMVGRSARSSSILTSPQSVVPSSRFAFDDQLPPWSQQTSRRNSDEDEKEEAVRQDPTSHRATNAVNRYSMPVTKSRTAFYDIDNLDQANTTGFLFRDDEIAPEGKLYTQSTTEDAYSNLLRQTNMSTVGSETSTIGARPASYRHSTEMNNGEQKFGEAVADAVNSTNGNGGMLATPPKLVPSSFSTGDVPTLKQVSGAGMNPNHAAQQHLHHHNASMGRIPMNAVRHSRELSSDARNHNTYQALTSVLQGDSNTFVPGMNQGPVQQGPIQQSPIQQGPVQSGAFGATSQAPAVNGMASISQGVPPFGNNYYNGGAYAPNGYVNNNIPGPNGYNGSHNGYVNNGSEYRGILNGYSAAAPGTSSGSLNGGSNASSGSLLNMVEGLTLNNNHGYSTGNGFSPASVYANSDYSAYASQFTPPSRPRDNQTRIMQNRRQQDNEAMNKYNGQPLSAFRGQIYDMCKDQHGCRYLQKQIESRDPDQVRSVWAETAPHVIELMTDPFGNYLCQKLFEYCSDSERTDLVRNASQDMVSVALNQHGTRALQKMIENLSNREQVQLVIGALTGRVVQLIEDLNGNHVIQKCLNKLNSNDAQFIFEAVSADCVVVGTHRHGCCVLQRCIDHAEGNDKVSLIAAITEHALRLVQDPYGNYVIQYIIDINEPLFTNPIVVKFLDNTVELSCHKFSSNVIEKCLRCASDEFKDMIVDRLLLSGKMGELVRDQFGNYVIQTSIEHATPAMKQRLVDAIRPMLPTIKTTAFGRKIQHKIAAFDGVSATRVASNQMTPADNKMGQIMQSPEDKLSEHSGGSRGSLSYRNGNNGSNGSSSIASNGNGNGNRAAQPFVPSTQIRGSQNQSYGSVQRAQQNQGFEPTPPHPQQNRGYAPPQRAQQNQNFGPTPTYAHQQSQDFTPAQRTPQNQNFSATPQRAQQNQHYARPQQQIPNRFGAFASRNGSPGANGTSVSGTPVHNVAPNGYNVPEVPQSGDGTFF